MTARRTVHSRDVAVIRDMEAHANQAKHSFPTWPMYKTPKDNPDWTRFSKDADHLPTSNLSNDGSLYSQWPYIVVFGFSPELRALIQIPLADADAAGNGWSSNLQIFYASGCVRAE